MENKNLSNGCIAAIIFFVGFVIYTCSTGKKEEPKQQEQPSYYSPAPEYHAPYYTPVQQTQPSVSEKAKEVEPVKEVEPEAKPIQQTRISKYYEEGYEKGYDDGEDDAVMDNGWGGQYDDECRYTGKKKKEYQLGYEEGYEAGYYDNKDSDE